MQRTAVEIQRSRGSAKVSIRRDRQRSLIDVPGCGGSRSVDQCPGRTANFVKCSETLVLSGSTNLRNIQRCRAAATKLECITAGAEHIAGDIRAWEQRQRVAAAAENDRICVTADRASVSYGGSASAGQNSIDASDVAAVGYIGKYRRRQATPAVVPVIVAPKLLSTVALVEANTAPSPERLPELVTLIAPVLA